MNESVTLTLSAPSFSTVPGWTANAIVHMLQQSLVERCDLTGVEIRRWASGRVGMTARKQGHFEIVRTDAGWHIRFRASNGRIVFVTESYTRRRAAVNAITSIANHDVSIREIDERVAA